MPIILFFYVKWSIFICFACINEYVCENAIHGLDFL